MQRLFSYLVNILGKITTNSQFKKIVCTLIWFSCSTCIFSYDIPKVWQVPQANAQFVGRRSILKQINEAFQNKSGVVVLQGGAGFGKTQIAKSYAHKVYQDYDVVWWFDASCYLQDQIGQFAQHFFHEYPLPGSITRSQNISGTDLLNAMHPKRLMQTVVQIVKDKGIKILIVLDNVSDMKIFNKDLSPLITSEFANILVTTRQKVDIFPAIFITYFSRQDSIMFIKKLLPQEHMESCKILAEHMQDYPISLDLAVNTIRQSPTMTIKRYLELLPQIQEKLLKQSFAVSPFNQNGDLHSSLILSLQYLQEASKNSLQLLRWLSFLNSERIPESYVVKWCEFNGIQESPENLLQKINQQSLIEVCTQKINGKREIAMHELIKQMVVQTIPIESKKEQIDQAVYLLAEHFSFRTDLDIHKISQDDIHFQHAMSVIEEAYRIDYITPAISSLSIKVAGILMAGLRDFERVQPIFTKLEQHQDVEFESVDAKIDYHTKKAFFLAMCNPNYTKAIAEAKKGLDLLNQKEDCYEYKVRTLAIVVQYHFLKGEIRKCNKYIKKGLSLLNHSKSNSYNSLFLYVYAFYLTDRGEYQKAVDVIENSNFYTNLSGTYPALRLYIRLQKIIALLKQNNAKEASQALQETYEAARSFFADETNYFFANLSIMGIYLSTLKNTIPKSFEDDIKQALKLYSKVFKGEQKHRNQAFAYLILAKAYAAQKRYPEALQAYQQSEAIFDHLFVAKEIDDLSHLYMDLAFLGIKMKQESLTHTYLQRHIEHFGIEHHRTHYIILELDRLGLALPL
ncbi:MAG: tetratricopeptide repeat protein [Pseudomonadota bacterium]